MKKKYFLFLFLTFICLFSYAKYLKLEKIINLPFSKYPVACAKSGDYLFVADIKTKFIYKITLDGKLVLKFGSEQTLKMPLDIECDGLDNVYVADGIDNNIKKYSISGEFYGIAAQNFDHISDLFRDKEGFFYIADYYNKKIKVYSTYFKYKYYIFCMDEKGNLFIPTAVCATSSKIFVSSWKNNKIYVYNKAGRLLDYFSGDFYKAEGIISEEDGKTIVEDWGNCSLKVFNKDYELEEVYGKFGSSKDDFKYPSDMKEYDNKLYITDSINKRIKIYVINKKKDLFVKISEVDAENYPYIKIYFKSNFKLNFSGFKFYINGKEMEFLDKNADLKYVKIKFPDELAGKKIDFYGYCIYNKKKVYFEKKYWW